MSRTRGLILALALLASACSSDGDTAAESVEPTATTNTAPTPDPTEAPAETTSTAAPATTTGPAPTTTATPDPPCVEPPPGVQTTSVTSGDNVYEIRLFAPTSLGDAERLPAVLNWHGLGSNGDQQSAFSLYDDLAEEEHFLVVAPTGFPSPGDEQDRNTWELPQFDVAGRDDIAFASELIDLLISDYCVDESRVYSTGMSNGGLFTSQLVCQLGDRIAAATSIAGITHPEPCAVTRGVPFLAFHGTADGVVPYDGTITTSDLADDADAPDAAVEFFAQVMPDEFAEFAADMGCEPEPTFSDLADDVRVHEYTGCLDDAPMRFYEVIDGGHTWPGSPFSDVLAERGLGNTTPNVDATADSWAFFEQHTLLGA